MKVYTIGETVLDIIIKEGMPVSMKAGGSVLNSSVSLGRLGAEVHFISDYGVDKAGEYIDDFLSNNHVNTRSVIKFRDHKTAIALAFLDEHNNASYSFYKDFPEKRLEGLSINFNPDDYLLFGSFFAISGAVREGLLHLLKKAENAGATIIYDPNFRKPHLHELEKVRPWIIENMKFADIVKGSDEDFKLIFETENPHTAYMKVKEAGCEILILTSGPGPVYFRSSEAYLEYIIPRVKTVSTIGAGDNFNAGIVYSLWKNRYTKKHLATLAQKEWEKVIKNGVSFAAEVCGSYDNYISKEFAEKHKGRS